MQVKCPNCSSVLRVANSTGPIKVKCPKCSTVLRIGRPSRNASQPKAATASQGQGESRSEAASKTKASASSAAKALDDTDSFGFLDLPEPTTQEIRQFRQAGPVQPYIAPAATPPQAASTADQNQKSGNGIKSGMIAAIIGGITVVLLLIGVGVTFMMRDGASNSTRTPSVTRPDAPPGFAYFEANGVSVLMPDGDPLETFASSMEMKAIRTQMGTTFLLGCTPAIYKPMELAKLEQRLDRLMASGVVAGMACERKGVQGCRAILDQSIYLPTMDAEIYQDSGRIIVIAVTSESSGGGNYVVGQKSEPGIQKVFFESFAIGPATSNSFW